MTDKAARRKRQRGQAFVETALIFTVAIGMILFILDMGRILLMEQLVAERARQGVRNAVVNNWDDTAVANYVAYGSTTAPTGGGAGLMGLMPSEVKITRYADSGIGDARYKLTVTGISMFTWIPYIAGKYTAPAVTATMPVQSQGATN